MVILSNLLSVTEPSGFWITIIKAFEAVTNNYVLAIIFLTVVIGLVWCVVETLQKFNQQHMNEIQTKMQPELDKLKEKYETQPQVYQQKQNELYQKYYGKSQIGSCVIMIITLGLNLLIFFTLFAGLNAMSSYKISSSYDSIKFTYANCLNVTDEFFENEVRLTSESEPLTEEQKLAYFNDYENLKFVITGEGENKEISLLHIEENQSETLLYKTIYKLDFSEEIVSEGEEQTEGSEQTTTIITTNENIIKLIEKYFPKTEDGEIIENNLSTALQNVAMKNVVDTYDQTKDSFLWIENIWLADSPLNQSIVSYTTLESQIGKSNLEAGEETIYNAFMPDLKTQRSRANGYFILPILCVLASFLTMYLSTFYNRYKNKKKGLPVVKTNGKWAQIILPIIFGIFALFYNSVFAIYMLTRQIVSAIILIPQLMFVDFILDKRKKRKEDKEKIVVDYSRKF